MKLYHFTAPHLWKKIKDEGLTKGGVVQSLSPPVIKWGYRWLTQNPEFNQHWNTMTFIDYDRSAVRITIEVPDGKRFQLYKWITDGRFLTTEATFQDLTRFGDPENWYVYKGNIPTSWFTDVWYKEKAGK